MDEKLEQAKYRLFWVLLLGAFIVVSLITVHSIIKWGYNQRNSFFVSHAANQPYYLNHNTVQGDESFYIGHTQAQSTENSNVAAAYGIKIVNHKAYWIAIIVDIVDLNSEYMPTKTLGHITGTELSKADLEDLIKDGIHSNTANNIIAQSKNSTSKIIDSHMYGDFMENKYTKISAQKVYNEL